MASSSLTDPFHFCFSALCDESKKFNDVFFSNDDCLIEDTREADFTKIENRLAYMYKFGYINSVLVEKCALAFFDQYFQGDKNYFSGNLKICSLSNGPGIDIVGFLCALYKSNKLKFSPLLHAVNLHDFWKDIFHNLICSVYLDYNSKCNETHTVIPPENIQFIQCDIFSSLSPQAQNFISTCDILLMVKVFISAKAPQILTERLQEIFSLLRPGALVFFFGSKNNIKEIMKDHVKKYVNYLFGPKLMDLEKLSTDENVPEIHPLKPKVCSKVKFIVLQKKNVSKETDATSQNVTKSAPSSTVLSPNMTVVNDSEEESDTDSEISSTSNTRPSDTLSMHSQYLSHENKLGFLNIASKSLNDADSSDEKKQSLNLPIESTSLSENTLSFEKINTEPVSNMARVDTVIKESLAGAFTLTDLPELDKLASHEGIAEKSVSTDSKQSSQLSDFDEVQSIDLSGEVKSVVLQEKDVAKETDMDSPQGVSKLKKPRRRQKKNKSTIDEPNFDELSFQMISFSDSEEESDTDSKISSTSNSKPSDALSIHSQDLSHENKLGFSNMASESLNDADCADEKKQSLNLPIESTSLSENTLPFEKINTKPVSNMARVDTVIKGSLTGEFTLTNLPELDKLASHEGNAEKSVSTDSKQSSQLSDFDEVQSPDLSGEVKSVVLQQKDVAKETDMDSPQSVSKLKKPRRRQKKNKSTIDEPNFDELSVQMISFSDSEEESDTDSKISSTSNSKPSDTLSIYSQDLSHENKLGFSNMASESLNDADSADEKKQSLNLPIESTSLSENTLPFKKINTEPVSNIAQKDTSSKENLTEGFTLTDLPELDKLASHGGIAEKSVSTESKQSSQLEDFDEVQYPDLSGEVKSIELQEKDVAKETDADSSQNVTKKNRRSKRKKNKTTTLIAPSFNQFSPNTATTFKEENYTNPEISHTSSIKLSDTFSIQSLHLSHENKFQSMASQSVNNTICAGDKKQTFNLLIESTSPSENALPFQKISAEPVSSMTKTDITSKESLTQELPLNKLPVFRKFLSRQGIAEKNVGIDSKQLSQLGDLGKVQSPNGARSVVMGMTSKKKLDRTETIASKQVQPPHNLPHEDLFQSPKMTACKEMGMQDTSNDRNKLTEVSRKEGCSSQMSCSTYNGAERDTKSLNAAKQPKLAAQRQFQPDIKNTVSEHFVGVRSSDDLHSMLQRCENVVTSLERAVACISTNMQPLQSSQVPMGECCSGYVGSAFRNLHCCNHCDNFSVQSCSRKNRCCMRTQTNVGVAHSNCVCCAERINDTRLCHSDTNPKPYFVIPVQNEILPHVLSFISKKT